MSEAPAATPSKPRVLVADDEQVIANTLAIILNQAGFEARAVYSGEKAIEALEEFQPDMLISDVIMTGMTGIEAEMCIRDRKDLGAGEGLARAGWGEGFGKMDHGASLLAIALRR